jgi:hypothetical protein
VAAFVEHLRNPKDDEARVTQLKVPTREEATMTRLFDYDTKNLDTLESDTGRSSVGLASAGAEAQVAAYGLQSGKDKNTEVSEAAVQ